MKIFAKIRAFYTIFTLAFYLALFIIILYFNPKRHRKMRKWVCRRVFNANRIKYELQGDIDPEAQMIILNHQSFLDIMLLELLHQNDLAWVAKQELFDLPFYGQTVKLPNMISVKREDKTGLKKLIEDAKDRINNNRVIAIFPEGTRSNGKKLLPFKPGAQFIANKLDLTVQPFVINSTINILNFKKKIMNPGTLKVQALPSFKAKEAPKEWLTELRNKMNKAFQHDN